MTQTSPPLPPAKTSSRVSRTILFFGITSLFADIAGEMLFPILPQYFTVELGISVATLGVIEGIANGTANLVQVWLGWFSDKLQKRKIFIILGYGTAALGKVFLALAHTGAFAFLARIFDRGGKGIRTSPRDALLAESVEKQHRGWAFGFHQTMDSGGAILGNALVIILLAQQFPLRHIVWLSIIPALLAILFILPIREAKKLDGDGHTVMPKKVERPTWKDFTADRKKFGDEFWKFIMVSVVFYLGQISYAFLLLRSGNLGVVPEAIPYLYIVFNIVQTSFSLPAGKLADGFGKAILVFMSFFIFTLMSFGFVVGGNALFLVGLFAMFGIASAFMEVGVRSFAVELSPHHLKATGLGIFYTVTGLTVIAASWIGGLLWQFGSGTATFWYCSTMTGFATILFFFFFRKRIFGAFKRTAHLLHS